VDASPRISEVNRLTPFQVEVAQLFFSLPESAGFLLAGGGALLASGLSSRPTRDLDFAGTPGHVAVDHLADQFMRKCLASNWVVDPVQIERDFARVLVSHVESLIVDIVLDSPAVLPPTASEVGPVFAGLELAARKLAALFGRGEARDFADVYVLSQIFERSEVLRCARLVDLGITDTGLAEAIRTINRFGPTEIPLPVENVDGARRFFAGWADELAGVQR
jgi:hypothetical protein